MNENDSDNGTVKYRRAAEKIDVCVRVVTPGIWALAAALGIIAAVIIIWGMVGTLPVNLEMNGVGINLFYDYNYDESDDAYNEPDYESIVVDSILGFINVSEVRLYDIMGKDASVVFKNGTRKSGKVTTVDTSPLSNSELHAFLDDYLMDTEWIFSKLSEETGGFRYAVVIMLDETLSNIYWGDVANVTIVTREERPLDYLLNSLMGL